MTAYDDLMTFQRETMALFQVAGRLGWDQETMMPRGAAPQRGEEMAAMTEETAEPMAEATHSDAMAPDLNVLLSTEGWDAEKVGEAIDASDLNPLRKTGLKSLVEAAPDSGPLLDAAIETVREALNVDG